MSNDYGNDFVTLTGEDGETYEFEILKELDVDGVHYAALLPADEEGDEESEDVYIVRIVEENNEEIYEVIEDDDEYERVARVFEQEFENDLAEYDEDEDEEDDQ